MPARPVRRRNSFDAKNDRILHNQQASYKTKIFHNTVDSSDCSDSLNRKMRKMEDRAREFDIQKRRKEDKDFNFIQSEGKQFLISVNKMVEDTALSGVLSQSKTLKSESSQKEQPKDLWLTTKQERDWEMKMQSLEFQ